MQIIRNVCAACQPLALPCKAAVAGGACAAVAGAWAGPAGVALGLTLGGTAGALFFRSPGRQKPVTPEVPYYTSSDNFVDYGPAYRFGHETCSQFRGQRFEDMEAELERLWRNSREARQLPWDRARFPVRRIWSRSGGVPAGHAASEN